MDLRRPPRPLLPALLALLAVGLILPSAAPAQRTMAGQLVEARPEGAGEAEPGSPEPPPPPLPGAHEVVPRLQELREVAEQTRRRSERLGRLEELTPAVEDVVARQAELARRAEELSEEGYLRRERLAQIEGRVRLEAEEIAALLEEVSGRLRQLTAIRTEWKAREEFWQRWRRTLAPTAERVELAGEFEAAEQIVTDVLEGASGAFSRLLDLQRRLEALRQGNQELAGHAELVLEQGRERLLERTGPLLGSAAFVDSFGGETLEALREGLAGLAWPETSFFERVAWVIALHLLVLFAVAAAARRFRPPEPRPRGWGRVLQHPWATGTFAATTLLGVAYEPMPAVWELLLWTLLALSGTVVAAALFTSPLKRRVLYGLAVFYPVFNALEILALPAPLFRLFVAAAAALGVPALWWTAWRARQLEPVRRPGGFPLALYLGAAALAVALATEILGFDLFARWLVQSTAATGFVVFGVTFLLRLGRGAIHAFLERETPGRLPVLSRIGRPLAGRLSWLLQAVLVVSGLLYVLDLWGVVPSPLETWRLLWEAGLPPREPSITVGQVLLAALALYLAFTASWVLRSVLDSEVVERRELDPGVGDSIKSLLHYSVVVMGLFLALGLLGVSLTSFALIAGALGVGIGFGLQNIVSNFASGLILLFERPVRAGDTVVIAGEWGTIQKIGLRSTVVVTFDRAAIIVPNSDLVSEKVTNWTLSDKVARVILPVGVAYGSDVTAVLGILADAAAAHPKVLEEPAPLILFTGFGESSLDFEARVYVGDISVRLATMSELFADIERRLREAGITIPFPQRDLHLRSVDERAGARLGGRLAPPRQASAPLPEEGAPPETG